jgi:hypothetical protein
LKGGRLKVSGYDKKWEKEVLALADGIRMRVFEHTVEQNGGYLSQACSSAEIFAALEKDPGATPAEIARAAKEGAAAGVEATKAMKPKFGKAAVHEAAAEGVADQGALVCYYLAEAMYRYISGK